MKRTFAKLTVLSNFVETGDSKRCAVSPIGTTAADVFGVFEYVCNELYTYMQDIDMVVAVRTELKSCASQFLMRFMANVPSVVCDELRSSGHLGYMATLACAVTLSDVVNCLHQEPDSDLLQIIPPVLSISQLRGRVAPFALPPIWHDTVYAFEAKIARLALPPSTLSGNELVCNWLLSALHTFWWPFQNRTTFSDKPRGDSALWLSMAIRTHAALCCAYAFRHCGHAEPGHSSRYTRVVVQYDDDDGGAPPAHEGISTFDEFLAQLRHYLRTYFSHTTDYVRLAFPSQGDIVTRHGVALARTLLLAQEEQVSIGVELHRMHGDGPPALMRRKQACIFPNHHCATYRQWLVPTVINIVRAEAAFDTITGPRSPAAQLAYLHTAYYGSTVMQAYDKGLYDEVQFNDDTNGAAVWLNTLILFIVKWLRGAVHLCRTGPWSTYMHLLSADVVHAILLRCVVAAAFTYTPDRTDDSANLPSLLCAWLQCSHDDVAKWPYPVAGRATMCCLTEMRRQFAAAPTDADRVPMYLDALWQPRYSEQYMPPPPAPPSPPTAEVVEELLTDDDDDDSSLSVSDDDDD